jgi:hypothetical protein
MPQHQSARKDSQGYQDSPKGQVNADKSQLTASQTGKENRLIGSRVEVAHKFRRTRTPADSCGEASTGQFLETRQRFCDGGGIQWIKFVACIARYIHHDLFGHDPRPVEQVP